MLKKKIFCISFLQVILLNVVIAQQPKLMLPVGNTEMVTNIKFSKNSKYFVSSSSLDNNITVWEVQTGRLILNLTELEGRIQSAHLTDDENHIVIFFSDGFVKCISIQDGSIKFYVKSQINIHSIRQIFFSPLKTFVVMLSSQGVYYKNCMKGQEASGFINLLPENKFVEHKINWVSFIEETTLLIKYYNGQEENWNLSNLQKKILIPEQANKELSFLKDKEIKIESERILIIDTSHSGPTITLTGNGDTFLYHTYNQSPSGKYIVIVSDKGNVMIWQTSNGKQIATFTNSVLTRPVFNSTEDRLIFENSKLFSVYDINLAKHLGNFQKDDVKNGTELTKISNDGKWLAWSKDLVIKIWDIKNGKFSSYLRGRSDKLNDASVNTSGELLLSASWDKFPKIWSLKDGKIINSLKSPSHNTFIGEATIARFNNDASKIISYNKMVEFGQASVARQWVINDRSPLNDTGLNHKAYAGAVYSSDGNFMVAWKENKLTISAQGNTSIKNQVVTVPVKISKIVISPDNLTIGLILANKQAKIWSMIKKVFQPSEIETIKGITLLQFSSDGKIFAAGTADGILRFSETVSGRIITTTKEESGEFIAGEFSPDNEIFVTASLDETFKIWQPSTGKLISSDEGHKGYFLFSSAYSVARIIFSPDGKYFYTSSGGGMTKKWDAKSFAEINSVNNTGLLQSMTNDAKFLITIDNAIIKFYNINSMELEISYLPVDSIDYLVIDKYSRYDGTEAARKLLYFTCGTEVIELDQVKDQLWVPNLAERIMKGETINAKTLDEMNICGLTPETEDVSSKADEYHFKIIPRRGGLGETILFVNGNLTETYKPEQLKKNGDIYELIIKKEELSTYFIAGENLVTVKAYTSDNAISSRGLIIKEDKTKQATTPPNLYAVMVGVSDYKGNELDLKYAAKDATDISAAVSNAAKKLLNTDGKEHVFMYNLTTAKEHYLLPEKNSIKKVLEEIGTKATANDILMIFFAGHGVMTGEADKKQFYFLSADASSLSTTDAVKDVGISTTELLKWMKPQNIKAQKRILIFDACNSGQAINDIASKDMEVRNDDKAQQTKAIDKLNEKSGLFILAASASNQSAYEMGRYSQGLLTYSLLKAIKQQPDILEHGKYLNVSRWFNAAEKTVSELSRESGARQEPQIVTNTNFNVGVVDEEVMAKIILPQEKPLFAASNFQNADENIMADDLGLYKLTDQQLNDISARGAEASISYMGGSSLPDAYTLTGRYTVAGNTVSIKIIVRKNNETKHRLELTGTKDKLNDLAKSIVVQATEWVARNK